jgi:hypothetical protein
MIAALKELNSNGRTIAFLVQKQPSDSRWDVRLSLGRMRPQGISKRKRA